jgi:hypothetical protein
MTTETVNILALMLGIIAVIEPFILSYLTNKFIQKEDERAKRMIDESKKDTERMIMETQRMIDEGNKRLEKILLEIDKSTKEILGEIFKKI